MNFKKILLGILAFPFVFLGMLFTALVQAGKNSSNQDSSFDDDQQHNSAFTEAVHEDDGDDGDDE
jgi:hypothetical protein